MRSSLGIALSLGLTLGLAACSGGSNFSGSGGKKAAEPKKPTAAPETADAKPGADDGPGDGPGKETAASETPSQDATGPAEPEASTSDAPAGAVTQGSFTAWTVPPKPAPEEDYWIHIEVKLPPGANGYQQTDLSGRVIGTDGYDRGIGRDSKGALDGAQLPPWVPIGKVPADQFQLTGRTAKISVWVPGAEELVRDTIKIHSELLGENQTLEIVFQ